MMPALLLAMIIGVPIGIFLGVMRLNLLDQLLRPLVLVPVAVPALWLWLLLLLSASRTGDFPLGGRCPITFSGECSSADPEYLTLPLVTMSTFWIGMVVVYIRAALVDVGQRVE